MVCLELDRKSECVYQKRTQINYRLYFSNSELKATKVIIVDSSPFTGSVEMNVKRPIIKPLQM